MNLKGILLFDIDGVIRDVTSSYRLAIQETVKYFTAWNPSIESIDELKSEGCWNNDWDATLELIKRFKGKTTKFAEIPNKNLIIKTFSNFYFGGDPEGDPMQWKGFIKNEPLLVNKNLFNSLEKFGIKWGFISGAEPPSARFVLQQRLGLTNAPLIAMGEAPEKPNPKGLLHLAKKIKGSSLGQKIPWVAYLGDTVADVLTIQNAKRKIPSQSFLSIAIAPPHLHKKTAQGMRIKYEQSLKKAGANLIIQNTNEILDQLSKYSNIEIKT